MTRERLVALLSTGLDAHPTRIGDGLVLCHTPFVAPLAYLHGIYPPLLPDELAALERQLGRKLPKCYSDFLCTVGNGARLYNLGLCGFVGQLRRDAADALGQPISLSYGNIDERPKGLDENIFAIGGMVGWSSHGTLVMEPGGEVFLVHHRSGLDVAARWSNIDAMLEEEIARLSPLYDRTGRRLATATETMHPGGRKWETSVEPSQQ